MQEQLSIYYLSAVLAIFVLLDQQYIKVSLLSGYHQDMSLLSSKNYFLQSSPDPLAFFRSSRRERGRAGGNGTATMLHLIHRTLTGSRR